MTEDTPLRDRLIITVCNNLSRVLIYSGLTALGNWWLSTGGPL